MHTVLVWFRSDLRLADHPALSGAVASGARVVPVYVHAPTEAGAGETGGASRWWLHHSLVALADALGRRGSSLVVREGPSAAALGALARETGAAAIYWNRSYEPALAARDSAVALELEASGVEVRTFAGNLLVEPWAVATLAGGPFRVFTPFSRACLRELGHGTPPLPTAAVPALPGAAAAGLPIEALGLLPRPRWDGGLARRFTPGETGAGERLAEFIDDSLAEYPEGRDRPDRPGTSRLSAHLHFGELSPRQALATLKAAEIAPGAAGRARGAEGFLRQLLWREFAHHVLHHFPRTVSDPLDPRFATHEWRTDAAALAAWQRGRTGVPLVDAGMRELWATGWMHNRVRMMVASFLTKNLGLHWRDGARWFNDTLVDADLANNTLGWQWTAGCGADAAPYYRIFSATLQAERFDPDRAYLRQWLPELAALDNEWLHRPWLAPPAVLARAGVELGRTYPAPIVDLKLSRERALEGYHRVRGRTAAPPGR